MTTDTETRGRALDVDALTADLHLDTARAIASLPAAVSTFGPCLESKDSMVIDLTRDLVRAGLPIHDCDQADRRGGVCLGTHHTRQGVLVSWTAHRAARTTMPSGRRVDLEQLLGYALSDVLCVLGWDAEIDLTTGAHLVTGRLDAVDPREGDQP